MDMLRHLNATNWSLSLALEGYLRETLAEEAQNPEGKFTEEQCQEKRELLKELV